MKQLYIVSMLAIIAMCGCATVPSVPEAPKVIEETVRTKTESFKRNIKIEISLSDAARIENVYLEHKRKMKKTGEKDYLYVNGSIKNISIPFGSGFSVIADFFDEKGNVIARVHEDVIPRIVRRHKIRKWRYFSLETDYDLAITQCKLRLSWYKEGE